MPRTKMTSQKFMGSSMESTSLPRKRSTLYMGGVKRARRYRPGTVALREIRKYQTSTDTLIPKLCFQRLVKEIMHHVCRERHIAMMKIQSTALLALQTAAEYYLTELFSKSQLLAIHGNRVTVKPEDVQIVRCLSGESDTQHMFSSISN